jgi:hypothetical protein
MFDQAVISVVLKLYRGSQSDHINKAGLQMMGPKISDEVEYDVVSE